MFRALGKSKIAFVLAILFGISLFFFRGSQRYSNLFNSDNVVASVSGTPISTTTFMRSLQLNVNQYNQMIGRQLTAEEIQTFQIHSIALSSLVNNAVFENEFDSINFIVDEKVVASETKNRFPRLYNKDNKLDEKSLNDFLRQQNLKIDDLVNIIDFEVRSRMFDNILFNTEYPGYIETFINKYNNQVRNVDLIKFNINDFEYKKLNDLDISLSNNKINEFYNQNISNYIDPETRDISYIVIKNEDFKNQFIPSESEIRNYYQDNQNLFLEAERRDFIQFNFKSTEEALKFKKEISNSNIGEVLEFAKNNQLLYNEFKKVSEDEVLEELSKNIFNLQINQVSEIVETTLAKHIVIVKNIYPSSQKSLNSSKDLIAKMLSEVEINNYILDLKNQISQQIIDGYSLNDIALNNSLLIKTLSKKIKSSNSEDFDFITNQVISEGFKISKDFVSDIIDISDTESIILNVDNIDEAKPKKLEDIFDIVSNDWIKSLKLAEIKTYTDDQKVNTNSIKDISKFANANFENINVDIDNNDLPKDLINNLFQSKLNELKVIAINDEIYVSRLNQIIFPEKVINTNEISILPELRGIFGAEIVKTKNISTNDNLIEAIISQYQ